jgi:chitinase
MYTRKPGPAILGFALMLMTTPSYGQNVIIPQINSVGTDPDGGPTVVGPPHNVIYWAGNIYDVAGNNIGQTLLSPCNPITGPTASGCYTDVIISSVFPNPSCTGMEDGTATGIVQSGQLNYIVQQLHSVGKTVLLSVGGPTPTANLTSQNYQSCYYNNMSGLVTALVNYVNDFSLDGIDIDFEDSAALSGTASPWYDGIDFLTQLTNQLFNQLPPYHNIITHAPEVGYWINNANYTGTNGFYYQYPPYVQVWYNTEPNSEIAWFNTQFYNDGDTGWQQKVNWYTQIVSTWLVPPLYMVLGLPVSANAGNNYIPPGDVQSLIGQLQGDYPNRFGGIMGWSADNDNATWNSLVWNALKLNQAKWYAWDNAPTGGGCLNGGSSVSITACNGGAFPTEYWQFSAKAIINAATQQCLDSGQAGLTLACNGGNYQNWQFYGNTSGGATIISQQSLYQQFYNEGTPYCLDGGQTPPYFPCNFGPWQSWWGGSQ